MSVSIFKLGGRCCGVSALALFVTACGGGGGETSTAPVVTLPTPTPTSTPTPTPTPTPSVTYVTAFDFSRDQVFEGPFAEVRVTERYNATSPSFYVFESAKPALNEDPRAARIDYRAEQQSLNVTLGSEATFFPRETAQQVPAGALLNYAKNEVDVQTTFQLVRPRPEFQYLSANLMTRSGGAPADGGPTVRFDTNRYFLFGVPTQASDVPTSGGATYVADLLTSAVAYRAPSGFLARGNLTFDFAASVLSGTLVADRLGTETGTTPARATLIFSGSESNGTIRGTITSPDSAFTGSFVGRLYGPQGAELGLVFTISRTGWSVAGRVTAQRG